MLEILISMAIFAIGFVAVSAIFPAAIYLQKQTADAVQGESLERSIKAMLQAKKIPLALARTLPNPASAGDLQPWNAPTGNMTANTLPDQGIWRIMDRSFPSNIPNPTLRRYFWVPLFRNKSGNSNDISTAGDWEVYVLLLQTDGRSENNFGQSLFERLAGRTYANRIDGWIDGPPLNNQADPTDSSNDRYAVPGVFSVPGTVTVANPNRFTFSTAGFNNNLRYIRSGDQVLDNRGIPYTIVSATNNTVTVQGNFLDPLNVRALWLAQPPSSTGNSALMKIMLLTDGSYIQ